MTSRATVTFALVKSLYDDNQDLLTVLRPFFLSSLKAGVASSDTEIQTVLLDSQAIDLPIHVIQKCGESAAVASLVKVYRSPSGERQYTLTGQGAEAVLGSEAVSDVKRRVRHATAYLAECIGSRGVEVTQDEVDGSLRRLIARNLETVVGFVVSGGDGETLDVNAESAIESALAECVTEAARSQPDVYQTLRDLVYGSVVLATLTQADDQLMEAVKKPLDGLTVFADTNWILGVLELDTPAHNLAALELVRLAKKCGVTIKMLDFVCDETRALLKHYEDEYDTGRLPIDPGSVFMQMKLHGKRPGDVLLLRTYLEDTLAGHGIEIERTGVDPRKYRPKDAALVDILMNLKHEESPRRSLVDLAAIGQVESRRGTSVPDLESCQYVILSCDTTLVRFNLQQMGHSTTGTYPEVIRDKSLTTILWLKNPGLDIPLETLVAAHSRGLLHRQAVWFQVVTELARAAASGKADPRDISIFLSSDGPDLIADNVTRLEDVTPRVIRQMVDEARSAREAELEAVRVEVEDAGRRAVGEVQNEARASIEKVQAEAQQSVGEAIGDVSNLKRQVKDLQHTQDNAAQEMREQTKTRAWIWSLVVSVVFALSISVCVLLFRPYFEARIGQDIFRGVAVPVCIGVMTVGAVASGSLAHWLTIRRGEQRLRTLFGALPTNGST